MSHRSKLYGMYEEEGEFDAIMGMSKGEKMLEDLGYIKQYENDNEICYLYEAILLGEKFEYSIEFYKPSRTVSITDRLTNKFLCFHAREISAINEICKELGWLDAY